jgi:glycosyltransferase involved in cell wall biosynthesis
MHKIYHLIKYIFLLLGYRIKIIFSYWKFRKFRPYNNSKLVFTHSHGGGTELYIKNILLDNNTIIVRNISYYKKDICYIISYHTNRIYISILGIKKLLLNKFSAIYINSLYSYYGYFTIIQYIVKYKEMNKNCTIKYFVHDFHAICPSFNLIAKGEYCKLNCNKNKCQFNLFHDMYNSTIEAWRYNWNRVFFVCDEIRTFSFSSRAIFLQVYSNIEEKITIIPHSMNYCTFSPIVGIGDFPVHVGIIGNCNTISKGSLVIRDFLNKVDTSIPVTLVGLNEKQVGIKKKNVNYTGIYIQKDLPDIIKKEQISIIFFTSICPETFSYLVSELMILEIPIICFNLGAQAEKIKNYKKGIVLKSKDIDEVIKTIKLFSKKGY